MVGKVECFEEVTFNQRLKALGVRNLRKVTQVEARTNTNILVLTSLQCPLLLGTYAFV